MRNNILISGFILAGLFLNGCGSDSKKTSTAPKEKAPVVQPIQTPKPIVSKTTIKTTAGKLIEVSKTSDGFIFGGNEGKIVLLEVYGDTCPHCKTAISSYNAIHAKYPNDVRVIALESYGTLSNAGLQQYDTVPRADSGEMFTFIREATGYNLNAVPFLMILARNGSITYAEILSSFPEAEIEQRIQQLL